MHLNFRGLSEETPDRVWRKVFAHGWPGWSEWYGARSKGEPSLQDARRALRRHMPEYETLWDELNTACGADDEAARFLSFWCPPRYLVNCSQAVLIDQDGPLLIRNYDLDPALNEATLLSTKWRGRRVIGMVEAMAGLSDGMNDAGLAVSLTFGGRVITQSGFGIPLILRYVLEMCASVQDAVEALRAIPSHMSYNITVIDKTGDWATVYLAPDRPAIVSRQAWATNHQLGVEWPRHGRISNTIGRGEHLQGLLCETTPSADALIAGFTRPPLFSTNYSQGFGTVYTAIYRPMLGTVQLRWRDGTVLDRHIDDTAPCNQLIHYDGHGSIGINDPNAESDQPEWIKAYLRSAHPQKNSTTPQDEEAARTRRAAFWRRNSWDQDQDWQNLTPLDQEPLSQEEP